jgi:3-vinyl bacteriochlorophyllide hydratase
MAITAKGGTRTYDGSGGHPPLLSFKSVQERRDASIWTRIHPVFAIGQLGVFLVSVVLLVLYVAHVVPFAPVYLSVLLKIVFMLGAIVTGSLWEHDVFGEWWFAAEFFVEDVMTLNVFLLHVGVVVLFFTLPEHPGAVLGLLVFAYVIYAINVAQYILQHASARTPADGGEAAGKRDVAA